MSVRKLTFGLLAVAALFAGQRQANAQEYVPVADPFRFDPNFRWFEPVTDMDLADMKPSKRAATGWFGSFDRMHLWFSRPDVDILREGNTNDYEDGLDRGWGNRLELGYMLDDDNGWSATWLNISGPNAYETLLVERLNRFNQTDFDGPDTGNNNGGGNNTGTFDNFGRLYPSADRNTPYFNERLYELKDSVNVLDANSFELNKTWRLEPYHYGGILEPLMGLRYFSVQDYWQQESYSTNVPDPNNPPASIQETLVMNTATTQNTMFGGQLGARYFRYQNRFRLSAEFRAFAMANWQSHRSVNEQIVTFYDGVGTGSNVLIENKIRTGLTHRDNDEFVFGFDARADMAYQLTRMFAVRVGFQMIDLGQGIWRGQTNDRTDQNLIMVGTTFGFELNR